MVVVVVVVVVVDHLEVVGGRYAIVRKDRKCWDCLNHAPSPLTDSESDQFLGIVIFPHLHKMKFKLPTKYKSILIIFCIILALVITAWILTKYKQKEGFADSGVILHYYWIVSDKRKSRMMEQLSQHPNMKSVTTFVPGIFSDDVSQTNHPNLPKEWLATPVARLLAAHMQAARMFKASIAKEADKTKHIFVCMEDDIVLHKEFETMAQNAAIFLQSPKTPPLSRLSLGYVSPPSAQTEVVQTYPNGTTIRKLARNSGDPWGTQCYMLTAEYVDRILQKYDADYAANISPNREVASDVYMFELKDSQHYILDPPACLEDFPTFGSLLGHGYNQTYYKSMIAKYDRAAYYSFGSSTPK